MLPLLNGGAEAQRVEVVPEPHSRSVMRMAAPVPAEGKGEGQSLTLGVGGQLCSCPSPGSRRPSGPAISPSPTHLSGFLSAQQVSGTPLLPHGPRAPGVVITDFLIFLSAPPL